MAGLGWGGIYLSVDERDILQCKEYTTADLASIFFLAPLVLVETRL